MIYEFQRCTSCAERQHNNHGVEASLCTGCQSNKDAMERMLAERASAETQHQETYRRWAHEVERRAAAEHTTARVTTENERMREAIFGVLNKIPQVVSEIVTKYTTLDEALAAYGLDRSALARYGLIDHDAIDQGWKFFRGVGELVEVVDARKN